MNDTDSLMEKMVDFLRSNNIGVKFTSLPEDTFMPGLYIDCGQLLIDVSKLTYVGDILHDGGHIALMGRAPVGTSPRVELGQSWGAEQASLNSANIPSHTHPFMASSSEPAVNTASGAVLASNARTTTPPMPNIYAAPSGNIVATGVSTGAAGSGSAPFAVVQPVLPLHYIICIFGLFPSRN